MELQPGFDAIVAANDIGPVFPNVLWVKQEDGAPTPALDDIRPARCTCAFQCGDRCSGCLLNGGHFGD